ncbi:general transcription factor II-I repeat domain-containing protein 2-like [Tachypleus tridentatus]|uniref:general transcription factor II-I repeat domain-containing protein 2-like n=1 Tax=Tachypleus tridentatus TaxID=6853 RepID=UPI003FCF8D53
MTGKESGFVGFLRENEVTCPTFHCVIHQGALRGKSVKQNEVFKLVVKVINMIRGGNKSLLYRQLKQFLEDMEAEYGDLAFYNQETWLSARKCLELFFVIRKEIPAFINQFVSSDTTQSEEELKSKDFLKQLAFLIDITTHLNDLNLKLQGQNQMVSNLIGNINGFRNKLRIFNVCLEKNDLTHFPSCQHLIEQFKDDEPLDFSEFYVNIEDIIDEFSARFEEFEMFKSSIKLFNNHCVDIKKSTR